MNNSGRNRSSRHDYYSERRSARTSRRSARKGERRSESRERTRERDTSGGNRDRSGDRKHLRERDRSRSPRHTSRYADERGLSRDEEVRRGIRDKDGFWIPPNQRVVVPATALPSSSYPTHEFPSSTPIRRKSENGVGEVIEMLRKKSRLRRNLLLQQFGLSPEANEWKLPSLRLLLHNRYDLVRRLREKEAKKKSLELPFNINLPKDIVLPDADAVVDTSGKKAQDGDFYHMGDTIVDKEYIGTAMFLRGTQSNNPHNDYSQHFVDTGHRPQNFIRDAGLAKRFIEYPKLRELLQRKEEVFHSTATPPMFLRSPLQDVDLYEMLQTKFEAIFVEPPLEEYRHTQGAVYDHYWSWPEITALNIESISTPRGFLFMWVGSSDGLEHGRRALLKWGYRRCEDIIWVKTNHRNPTHKRKFDTNALFERTKEHCLMGIKGTVKRSVDTDFIHSNIDLDIILQEEPEQAGSKEKPIEIFHTIERFCLARRRLHLFGRDTTIRPGWLTVGPDITSSNFDRDQYRSYFDRNSGGLLTGGTEEIERLRPKSPPPKGAGATPSVHELASRSSAPVYRQQQQAAVNAAAVAAARQSSSSALDVAHAYRGADLHLGRSDSHR